MHNRPMIDGIQILRGLAAFLVIIRHGTKEINGFNFEVGQFGVDLFFVISGFVIYLTSRNIDWYVFAKKRVIRIVPLYWLMTTVTLLGAILLNKESLSALFEHFVFSLFFIPHGDLFPTLYVGWTLNYEMWFYLIFGTLIYFRADLLKGSSITILSAIFLGLILLSLSEWQVSPLTVPLLPITIEFLAGVWIAHFYLKGFSFNKVLCSAILVAAVIVLAIMPTAGAYTPWRPLVWGGPAILVVIGFLGFERHIDFNKFGFLMLFGNASYATYLIHPLVIRFLMIAKDKFALQEIDNHILLFLLIAGSITAGLIFHLTIEKLLVNVFTNKFLQKKVNS